MLQPLAGLRVLDTTSGIAGAYCTKLLADAGADVARLEPAGGHPLRRRGTGALFDFLSERNRFVDAVAEADIVVADQPPAATPSVGLVHVSISPFGTDGPWAGRPATEFTLQAWCGSTGSRGIPERTPLAAGGELGEFVTGSFAAVGALAAWLAGGGEHVDVAMLDCMSVTMNTYASVFGEMLGWPDLPPDAGRTLEIPSIEPTADGFVGFCTITAQQFQDFLLLVERADLLDDNHLRQAHQRFRRRDEVWGFIRDWTTKHTTAEAIEEASALRIPVAPIGNGAILPTFDHFAERGVFVEHASGRFIQPRVPYKLHGPDGARPATSPAKVPDRDVLAGIRVIDFTAFWAGPAATHMLAALGADVVKIESVQRADGMRFTAVRPPSVDQWWEWGPVFHGANTGKRSVTLDLTSEEGLALTKELIAGADAVVENFTPRVLENFGLTWDVVHEVNPRALLVRMPGFGLDGPWRDRTGFAQTMEQISGLAWATGYEDGPPIIPRGACDPMAGMHAVFALLVALRQREADGEGRLIEVTMVETALNAAAEQVVEYAAAGTLLERAGNGPAPRGVYRCAGDERWVAIDPGDAGGAALPGDLDVWCAARSPEQVVDELWTAGVPVGVVISPRDVLHNPQLVHRRLFERVDHPVAGALHMPGAPFRFASRGDARWLTRPAPTLGEHTREVLATDLGLDDDTLDRLEAAAVIGTRPSGL